MYKIVRGLGVLEKGTPYLIVTVTRWQNTVIELEQFGFVVGQEETEITILPDLRTEIKTSLGPFPENPKLESDKLLEEELVLAKKRYFRWLYEQIGDRAFVQAREIVWRETDDIIPFSLMWYTLKKEECGKLKRLLEKSCCEEFESFIGKVLYLRLVIETKSN